MARSGVRGAREYRGGWQGADGESSLCEAA
jgi:hypothetical protein